MPAAPTDVDRENNKINNVTALLSVRSTPLRATDDPATVPFSGKSGAPRARARARRASRRHAQAAAAARRLRQSLGIAVLGGRGGVLVLFVVLAKGARETIRARRFACLFIWVDCLCV